MEMETADLTSAAAEFGKFIAGGGLSALVAWFAARLMLRKVVEEQAGSHRAAAEIDIISQLRQEVDRLHAINVRLSEKIDQLQQEIASLRTENSELRVKFASSLATVAAIGRRHTDAQ